MKEKYIRLAIIRPNGHSWYKML